MFYPAMLLAGVNINFSFLMFLLAIYFTKMPFAKEDDKKLDFKGTYHRLIKNKNYVWGVIAQFFYVGAQITV